ncbi:MAG: SAM-dependent DNA methyltransferase [Prosthecobacter sp.]|uniref:type I restriction-modification system subunit M n=1 Tax=Prosthecobacter sp. TaxID=1965333 RepID=UPI0019D80661|nr:class I SAM-dependent DNA methyltransferase [Prosthecobacter sp.]MBE2285281.1 SAM-dependent DNA methyltransferase [Prosthecobacter sp.]
MDHSAHNKLVSFIWSIADDCLRDVFVRGKYRDVILPMFVLRRIDCLLEDTKAAVLEEVRFQKEEARLPLLDPDGLRHASGQVFYNTSRFTLKTLLGNPSQLVANLTHYLDGFSDNVREIIEKFDLANQIRKMAEANALFGVIEKFVSPEINLNPNDTTAPDGKKLPGLSNLGMGYVFEELIRKFNEENNEEAGEHFTPREVIQLMVHLLIEPVKDQLPPVITIYDPACGSGGMLTEAQDYILDPEGLIRSSAAVYLYGKEVNPETYAICKSDMMIKGNNPENIRYGSTLATDEFSTLRFDFMLSNPPYGKSWKTDQGQILEKKGSETVIIDGRFEVTLPNVKGDKETASAAPAVDDGQLLFLMEMVSKMKRLSESPLGTRIATVHNGSALFTGNAGGGASNIRRYLIENDYLEAIIQLPNNIFYNTGITTYIWVLSNHKAPQRRGKVQLIDASQLYEKLRKNLGEKNCAFTAAHLDQITQAYLQCDADTPVCTSPANGQAGVPASLLKSKTFPNHEFGYWKITVERPLRKSAQYTADRIATLRFIPALSTEMEWIWQQWGGKVYEKGFLTTQKEAIEHWLEKEQIEITPANKKKLLDTTTWTTRRDLLAAAEKLHQHLGEATSHDFNVFAEDTRKAVKKLKLDLKPADVKAILDAVSWRDPEAKPILAGETLLDITPDFDFDAARVFVPEIDGGTIYHYEPDSELRDTENVPMTYMAGPDGPLSPEKAIVAYFQKEVLPHVPDAWVDEDKTVIGCEISFNKYFYQHQPLRPLEDVVAEIRQLETETEGLLEQILRFAQP